MPNVTSDSSSSLSPDPIQPLADRVRARVAEIDSALDRRARASRPKAKRARPLRAASLPSATPQVPAQSREVRSLRRVFHELAVTHRQYRTRTGDHVTPALRDAARAFQSAPSLPSLVVVAAFLEETGLLAW
jgi:hypothetical protein